MNVSCTIRYLLTLSSILLLSLTLSAQEDHPQYSIEDSITVTAIREGKVPTITTTATKLPINIRSAPMSVSVITGALIAEQNDVILTDALAGAGGVTPQIGNGVHDYFIVRGFNSLDNGLILTDGMPEPEATFYNLYNIDRVELLKGPGAFLYGGNPLSGAVNLVRKRPVFKSFAEGKIGFGSFGTYRVTADLGVADPDTGMAARVAAVRQESDGYRDGRDNNVGAVNPTFTWRTGERSSIHFDLEYVESNYTPDAGIPVQFDPTGQAPPVFAPVDDDAGFQNNSDFSNQTIYRGRLEFDYRFSPSLLLRNRLYYTNLDWRSASTLINGAFPTPFGSIVRRSTSQLNDQQKLAGDQLELLALVNTGPLKHKLLFGVEASQLRDDFMIDFTGDASVFLSDPAVTLSDPEQGVQQYFSAADGTARNVAPYFMDHISIARHLQIFVGGRYDVVTYEDERMDFVESIDQNGVYSAGILESSTDRNYEKFSPMGGIVISPLSLLTLYGSYGQAFAGPSTRVLGEPEAEESNQIEAGLRLSLMSDRLNIGVAGYQLEKDNISIPTSTGQLTAVGSQKSTGVEMEASISLPNGFFGQVSYAYLDAELTEFAESFFISDPQFGKFPVYLDHSGNVAPFSPEHSLNAWISHTFGNLGLGAGANYYGEQFFAPDNALAIDAVLTLDAALWYTLGQYRLRFNVNNVTDESTYLRGFGSTSVIPARPTAVFGGLEIVM